jgi:SAM-dependent methyltransferase
LLIDDSESMFDPSTLASSTQSLRQYGRLQRLLPGLSSNLRSEENFAHLSRLLAGRSTKNVLVIGAGDGSEGLAKLRDVGCQIVSSDVTVTAITQVGADAHQLPFASGSFDAVVAIAVLEHVIDPWRCVGEIHRVLASDGLVFADTPFMQQVHGGAYDFTRFTRSGHRYLFRRFEEIDSGLSNGPGAALAWALAYFCCSFAVSVRARKLLFACSRVSFSWLKYFDRVLRRDAALDAGCGFFFIGRRSEATVTPSELTAYYRGGIVNRRCSASEP